MHTSSWVSGPTACLTEPTPDRAHARVVREGSTLALIHQLAPFAGGALSFLVVFRTNSSYDRWWEARCAWQEVVNTCRSHATSVASSLSSPEATEEVLMLCVSCLTSP